VSRSGFDALIHAPKRLQICAVLASLKEVEFKYLRERLGVSDSVLSKHIKALEDARYVILIKRAENGRQRTWVSLSRDGRAAFNGHVKTLREIIN